MRTEQEAYVFLRELYAAQFSDEETTAGVTQGGFVFASAPGRVELAGNHTDHQGGCTIAGALAARAYALAALNNSKDIRVCMEGFGEVRIAPSDLEPHADEQESSAALIRGMIAAFARTGQELTGFNMVVCSDIPVGKGLSSSAAFEVLVGVVLRALFGSEDLLHKEELTELALQAVQVEQLYFGKPCGAQDQLASAHGGIALLDFAQATPQVTPLDFDFKTCAYTLYLIDSQSTHAHCASEYAAIPSDMHAVAEHFGHTQLGALAYDTVLEQLAQVRAALGDRAVLRALHFYEETKRVMLQAAALQEHNFEDFLSLLRLSGASSAQFLQNISARSDQQGSNQPVALILALCAHLLDSNRLEDQDGRRGAYRIVGGGFGGSVLAFVPTQTAEMFETLMNTLLGYDACIAHTVGSAGARFERCTQ